MISFGSGKREYKLLFMLVILSFSSYAVDSLESSFVNNSRINLSEISGYPVPVWYIIGNDSGTTKNVSLTINGTYQDSGNVSNNTIMSLYISTINETGHYQMILSYPYDSVTYDFVVNENNNTAIDANVLCCERYNSVTFLLIFDVLFWIFIFWLINNIRVDVDKVIERFGDGSKAVSALKIDIILKSTFLFIIASLGLFVVGFLNWIVKGLGQPLEWLSNMLYIANTIILFILFVLLVIKAFYFPFAMVKGMADDLAQEMGKTNGKEGINRR